MPSQTIVIDDHGSLPIRSLFPSPIDLVIATPQPDGGVLLRAAVSTPALLPRLRQVPGLLEELERSFGPDQTFVPWKRRERPASTNAAKTPSPKSRKSQPAVTPQVPGALKIADVVALFAKYRRVVSLESEDVGRLWGVNANDDELKVNVKFQFVFWAKRVRGEWFASVCLTTDPELLATVSARQAQRPQATRMWDKPRARQLDITHDQATLALPLPEMSDLLDEPRFAAAARELAQLGMKNRLSGRNRSNASVADFLVGDQGQ